MEKPIDFVILWVDGSDEEWNDERKKYYGNETNQNKASVYRDWDTLQYWFRGVEKFAPWVNKIYFVTCGHLPVWLNTKHPKLHIVKHEDFIPHRYLPTFSANSIELNINRIEGLQEQFVYFNDDTFIIKPVAKKDFFRKGLPCDSGIMSATIPSVRNEIFTYILFNDLLLINANFNKKTSIYNNWNKWFNLKYGKSVLKNFYYLPIGKFSGFENLHLPNAYLRSVWDEVWEKERKILIETICNRFRTKQDVNQYVFKYWQLAKGKFYPRKKNIGKCYIIGEDDTAIETAIIKQKYKLLCLNDNPAEIDFEKEKEKIKQLLENILPDKSNYEK